MAAEFVTVQTAGGTFAGWSIVKVQFGVNIAACAASLTVAATLGSSATHRLFELFTPLKVYAGADLVIDGYVDDRAPHFNAQEALIEIRIRSKAQDAVDCSAKHKTGEIKNATPLQVAQQLDSFGIGFTSTAAMTPLPVFRITKGESLFRAVERAAREQGLTLVGRPSGIELWNAKNGAHSHSGGLVEGVNIEVGSSSHNGSNRHSEVRVHGQKSSGHGAGAMQIEGLAQDSTVPRFRPKIIAHDGETDPIRAQGKAEAHRDRAAGNGLRAQIRAPGWRDQAGALWKPGNLVWTESPFLDIAQNMLIEHAVLEQSGDEGGGTFAELHLVDPRAYGGKAGKGAKSGAAWSMPSDS